MITDPLRCGGCGGDVFKLAHVQADADGAHVRVGGGPSFGGHVAVTCTGCGAASELHPTTPALRVEWAAGNDRGVLCGGWRA